MQIPVESLLWREFELRKYKRGHCIVALRGHEVWLGHGIMGYDGEVIWSDQSIPSTDTQEINS